jgi:hypothetical protein
MTMMTLTQSEHPVTNGFRVDVSRGERVGRVSSEWFSRPDDERYLSLTDLHDAVRRRADRAQARTVESRSVRVEATRDNAERLALLVPGRDEPSHPHIGVLDSCAVLSARPHPICANFPQHWPGSICNTACCHTAPSL